MAGDGPGLVETVGWIVAAAGRQEQVVVGVGAVTRFGFAAGTVGLIVVDVAANRVLAAALGGPLAAVVAVAAHSVAVV